jgi:hypothetical protein
MNDNFKLFEAAQIAQANNTPDSRWMKVQLAKISIKVLDPMTGSPVEEIIEGDPNKNKDRCIVDCWTPLETAFFQRNNRYHILNGNIVPFNKPIETQNSANTITDEEIVETLEKKFMAVKNLLSKLDSPVAVSRVLQHATEMNKPVATINAIKARLADLQQSEYSNSEK